MEINTAEEIPNRSVRQVQSLSQTELWGADPTKCDILTRILLRQTHVFSADYDSTPQYCIDLLGLDIGHPAY